MWILCIKCVLVGMMWSVLGYCRRQVVDTPPRHIVTDSCNTLYIVVHFLFIVIIAQH